MFDEDCYVLYALFGYQIKQNKTGFPISACNKVLNTLEEKKINYLVKDENKSSNYKKRNNYEKYYKQGKQAYEKDRKKEYLMEKVKELDEDKAKQLLKMIEEFLYE